jgi:hypothetical protein
LRNLRDCWNFQNLHGLRFGRRTFGSFLLWSCHENVIKC